jgi:peptide/nickel transport system permease protein
VLVSNLRFVTARIAGLVATLLIASFVIFGALYLAPGTPISFLTHGRSVTHATVVQLEHQYHLDEAFPLQYWHWLISVLHGDLGTSILYKTSVASLLGDRAINTVVLIVFAAILISVFGFLIGTVAGLRPGLTDNVLMLGATAVMAVPSFVAAVVLISVFSVNLGWLPVFGPGQGFADRLQHMTLPAIALALASIAYVARFTRTSVREELGGDHVQTAHSRGLPSRVIVRRHVIRNAMIPITTATGLTIAGLIAGSVVVEQVFQLNGLGSYLVQAVEQKDFPVVQAICLLYVAVFIVLNTLVDLTYSLLDPRIAAGRAR